MADDPNTPSYITQDALNAALKDIRERFDGKLSTGLSTLRTELSGEIGKVPSALMDQLKQGLPDMLKPHLPQKPADPGASGDSEGEGNGNDGKPKGPYANLKADFEKQRAADRAEMEKLRKQLDEQAKEREAEKTRLRQQAIDTRKDAARSSLVSALAGDKYIRDPEKAEALALKLERSGALVFDEQGNAKLITNRVRFQGEAAEPKDFDISRPEGLAAALADWAQTESAKTWIPATPAEKKPPNAAPARRTAPTTSPQQRGIAEQTRAGAPEASEDELLAGALERLGGADAVRDAIHGD